MKQFVTIPAAIALSVTGPVIADESARPSTSVPPITQNVKAKRCLQTGEVVEGRVEFFLTKQDKGRYLEVYQVVNADGYCVKDDACPKGRLAKRIHIIPSDESMKNEFEASIGDWLTIKATAYFCSHARAHVGDAIASGVTILSKRDHR